MISFELEPAEELCCAGDVSGAVGVVGLGGWVGGLGLGLGSGGVGLLLVLGRLRLGGEVIGGGGGGHNFVE